MKKLFGTDGIRGLAGEFPLDAATVAAIGASLANYLANSAGRPARLITGRDTRESGESIESAFHLGARSAGAEIGSAGVMTTPGVAFLTGKFGFDAGIVISASHNPFDDNGIKIFRPSGEKIGDEIERVIENDLAAGKSIKSSRGDTAAGAENASQFRVAYIEHLLSACDGLDMAGKRLVADCANGAASTIAPEVFSKIGAEVITICDQPNGRNINLNCGSLHLDGLRRATVEQSAAIGVAFDGDSDRSLFVDENGNIVDGDATLWILGKYFRDHGRLAGNAVVATVMSNIGLEKALETEGIKLVRTSVGDKYVLDELIKGGAKLGGEQSGHVIVPDVSLVGDGIMTALFLLRAMSESGKALSGLVDGFVRFPQTLVNVKVREKAPLETIERVARVSREIEGELDGNGRLLLRYSGTENLARVMIEGRDQSQIESQARRLAEAIRIELG